MTTEPAIPTLAQVAERAAAVCDPERANDAIADFLRRLEDRDEPITALADVEHEIAEVTGMIDPEGEDAALAMAGAVTVYLAHRRDEVNDDRRDVLLLATRAEFDGRPPGPLADWLAAQGVSL
jgi:cell pole-organizing protein PopZ